MFDLKCDVCGNNILESKQNNYPMIINNQEANVCSTCFHQIVKTKPTEITIDIVFDEGGHSKFLHRIKLYLISNYKLVDAWSIQHYNELTDNKIKQEIKKHILSFYGGSKQIKSLLKIDKIYDVIISTIPSYNDIKCSVCGSKLNGVVYLLYKDNQYSIVCKDCQDLIYNK